MSVPISISNPDLARHSTELFMDSGFSPLSQRMGAMVAFDKFEDFTRWEGRGAVPLGWGGQSVGFSPHPCCLGRNFDEVISCFADPPLESSLFSEARATVYEEEDAKVGTALFLSPLGGAGLLAALLG